MDTDTKLAGLVAAAQEENRRRQESPFVQAGRRGGKKCLTTMTAEARSERARSAASMRWTIYRLWQDVVEGRITYEQYQNQLQLIGAHRSPSEYRRAFLLQM